MGFLPQVFTTCQITEPFSHRLTLQGEVMGVVHQAVQNGICESVTGKCAVHFGLHFEPTPNRWTENGGK